MKALLNKSSQDAADGENELLLLDKSGSNENSKNSVAGNPLPLIHQIINKNTATFAEKVPEQPLP